MSDEYIIYDPAEFDKIEIKPVENSDKITRLRADLAAVTEERDRMRALLVCLYDAAGPLDADKMPADDFAQIITIVLEARAALEGVTEPASPKAETEFFVFDEFAPLPEPASPWRDIESAPRNGRVFLAINNRVGPNPRPKGYNPYFMCYCLPPDEGVTYASDAGWHTPGRDWPCYPTHWMPLPEPPPQQSGEENE